MLMFLLSNITLGNFIGNSILFRKALSVASTPFKPSIIVHADFKPWQILTPLCIFALEHYIPGTQRLERNIRKHALLGSVLCGKHVISVWLRLYRLLSTEISSQLHDIDIYSFLSFHIITRTKFMQHFYQKLRIRPEIQPTMSFTITRAKSMQHFHQTITY